MTRALAELIDACKSIVTGMGITIRYFFQPPVTLQYPYQKKVLSPRFRGPLKLRGIMGQDELEFFRAEIQSHNALMASKAAELRLPPCTATCPANVDVRGQNALVAEGKYLEALDLIRERNVFPRTLGRICHHPCEDRCRRAYYDEPIANRTLHRMVADYAVKTANNAPQKVEATRPEKVAIIGCGPAGLAAAYDLLKQGYQVTLFDKHEEAGGMLRYGVPRYRLPDDVLATDVEYVRGLGAEIQTGVEIGRDVSFEQLDKDYNAILIAVGLQVSRGLPIPGMDLPGVLMAVPFLYAANTGQKIKLGKKVIVIGGGNVAVDVARCAKRMGAKEVHMACLEARHEMPAFSWEIEEAIEEGIHIHCSWGPNRILEKDGKAAGLELKECACVFDDEGRFNPKFNECNLIAIEGNTLIVSIGQGGDLSFLKDTGVQVNERGQLVFDRTTMQTSQPNVFACGEVTTGPASAVGSIATGHEAAISIDRYLRGEDLKEARTPPFISTFEQYRPVDSSDVEPERRRPAMPMMKPEERVKNFEQIELGFSESQALAEAYRCLRCQSLTCVGCTFCARTCPTYAINVSRSDLGSLKREVHTYEVDLTKCIFCGMCALQCPTSALTMGPEYELAVYDRNKLTIKTEQVLRKIER
jgi:NADPH-dependent glutamate synthase beta subunit-like oxidoreductase